jgi:hypothetical protein
MNKLQHLRKVGLHAYRTLTIAKIMAFILSRVNLEVYWVFRDSGYYVVINISDSERINKSGARVKKLRVRDMDRICLFRTPKMTWGKIKAAK